ncbi:MAG: HAMP domain-containing histidine kinase, partial [Saprospiraceae bacterium]|nr:HAMP domain-containing histidine kinase [Saprospiraceae bacterium]
INAAITSALAFYDLPQKFDIEFKSRSDAECDPASPYCCKIGAYDTETDHFIVIRFPDRKSYVFGKMWVMLVSSLAILCLILMVFLLSIRALLAQKKISQFNIDFFNNMAHEFRTPLANIKLALSRVGRKGFKPEVAPYLNIIEGESSKLNENVERVLSLAKIEDGQYELHKEHIDLVNLLEIVMQDLASEIKDSNAEINIDSAVEGVSVWADPLHLRHAFKNLIDNSIKYCIRKPVIEIGIMQATSGIMLVFKDNGVGIDTENKEIVFDRFKRLGRKDHVKGFGLGLSYVKMIMDLHRGRINLFSHSGQGSRFELFFPQVIT